MTGPEHFKAAEELLAYVELHDDDFTPEGRAAQIAIAQVHATLASAAAAALMAVGDCTADDCREWLRAAGCAKPGQEAGQ